MPPPVSDLEEPEVPQNGEGIVLHSSRLLVVEGKDEKLLFESLLRHIGLSDVQVLAYLGNSKLRSYMKGLVRAPGFEKVTHLCVHRDAEGNATSSFTSVQNAVADSGSDPPLPRCLAPYEVAEDVLRVMILILPIGEASGMLEDVCMASVASDAAIPCVHQYFQCLAEAGLQQSNPSKSRAQAYLASRERDVLSIGIAAQKGWWRFEDAAFEGLRHCLARLYN